MGAHADASLSGKIVGLAETRQLDQLSAMLERRGATVIRCPLVAIVDNPDTARVSEWVVVFLEKGFDLLVFFTGEGLRRLLDFAERAGRKEAFIAQLRKTQKLTRGPKPARALKEIGLTPDFTAAEPTTDGILSSLASMKLAQKTVGVQLYSPDQDRRVTEFLQSAGATVHEVAPYRYASKSDTEQVQEFIRRIARGEMDFLAFTSASQVDRLIEVAKEGGLDGDLRVGLKRLKIAAVGPVVEARLQELGVRVDVVPESSYFMAPLVQAMVASLADDHEAV